MIITCPDCATRYELEEERFLPKGRSVRCTACGESWFVPAPEPIEALTPLDRADLREDEPRMRVSTRAEPSFGRADANDGPEEAEVVIENAETDLLPPRDEKGRFMSRKSGDEGGDDEATVSFDEDEDDALFDAPKKSGAARRDNAPDPRVDDAPPRGWRKGKQFYVEDDALDDDAEDRPFFAKHFSRKKEERPEGRAEGRGESHRRAADAARARDAMRFGEEDDDQRRPRARRAAEDAPGERSRRSRRDGVQYDIDDDEARPRREAYSRDDHFDDRQDDRDARYRGYDDDLAPGEAIIVDADFEDVDDPDRRFGRRIREERRRATALARMEDVRRFEPETLDDEFFKSLQVTPRELERAIRKARRRAEARDKNRLTPWRAFGWSAWVAVIAAAAYAVVVYRDEIVKVAPNAAEAYAVVGIETEPSGLKIEDVRHRLAMSTGGPMIEITGVLRNSHNEPAPTPLLQAEALGPRGELLSRWTFEAGESVVNENGVVAFSTRREAPDGVVEVALSFAPAQSPAVAQ